MLTTLLIFAIGAKSVPENRTVEIASIADARYFEPLADHLWVLAGSIELGIGQRIQLKFRIHGCTIGADIVRSIGLSVAYVPWRCSSARSCTRLGLTIGLNAYSRQH